MRLVTIVITIILLLVGISDVSAISCYCGTIPIFFYKDRNYSEVTSPSTCSHRKEGEFDPSPSHGECFTTFEHRQCDKSICRSEASSVLFVHYNKMDNYTAKVLSTKNKTGVVSIDGITFLISLKCSTDYCDVNTDAKESDLLFLRGSYEAYQEKVNFMRPILNKITNKPLAVDRWPNKAENGSSMIRLHRKKRFVQHCYCGTIFLAREYTSKEAKMYKDTQVCTPGKDTFDPAPINNKCFLTLHVRHCDLTDFSCLQFKGVRYIFYFNKRDTIPAELLPEDANYTSFYQDILRAYDMPFDSDYIMSCEDDYCQNLEEQDPKSRILIKSAQNFNTVKENAIAQNIDLIKNNLPIYVPPPNHDYTLTLWPTSEEVAAGNRDYNLTSCFCGKMQFHGITEEKYHFSLVNRSSCIQGEDGYSSMPVKGSSCIVTYKITPCYYPCPRNARVKVDVFFNNHYLYRDALGSLAQPYNALVEYYVDYDNYTITSKCHWQLCLTKVTLNTIHHQLVDIPLETFTASFTRIFSELLEAIAVADLPMAVKLTDPDQFSSNSSIEIANETEYSSSQVNQEEESNSTTMYVSLGILCPIVVIAIIALIVLIVLRKKLVQEASDQKSTTEKRGAQGTAPAATTPTATSPTTPSADTPTANTPTGNT